MSVHQSTSLTSICLVSLSVFRFRMITWVNINGFSPNLECAWILWWSGLRLLMNKFRQLWRSYLPETRPYFRFRTITWVNVKGFSLNLVHELILRRSGLGLLSDKFLQCLTELSARDTIKSGYYRLTFLLYDTLGSYWITPPTFMILLLQICNLRCKTKMKCFYRANKALNHSPKFHGLTPHYHY